MILTFARHLHGPTKHWDSRLATNELSRLLSGGEGGIRTLVRPALSASYRLHIARNARIATNAVDHCTLLHAGGWIVGMCITTFTPNHKASYPHLHKSTNQLM